MKKIILVSSVMALVTFSGCTTKYIHKCDLKKGTCEESLYTNSSNVAQKIVLGNNNCANISCKPAVKPLNKKLIKVSPVKTININVIVKPANKNNCELEDNTPITPNIDYY